MGRVEFAPGAAFEAPASSSVVCRSSDPVTAVREPLSRIVASPRNSSLLAMDTKYHDKVVKVRLREFAPRARGSQEVRFTQPSLLSRVYTCLQKVGPRRRCLDLAGCEWVRVKMLLPQIVVGNYGERGSWRRRRVRSRRRRRGHRCCW